MIKRIVCAAVVALCLMAASGNEAKANGFTFNPGYFNMTGSVGLSWGGGGWTCFNNCNQPGYGYSTPSPYGQPMMVPAYNPYAYGYGYGYGYGK